MIWTMFVKACWNLEHFFTHSVGNTATHAHSSLLQWSLRIQIKFVKLGNLPKCTLMSDSGYPRDLATRWTLRPVCCAWNTALQNCSADFGSLSSRLISAKKEKSSKGSMQGWSFSHWENPPLKPLWGHSNGPAWLCLCTARQDCQLHKKGVKTGKIPPPRPFQRPLCPPPVSAAVLIPALTVIAATFQSTAFSCLTSKKLLLYQNITIESFSIPWNSKDSRRDSQSYRIPKKSTESLRISHHCIDLKQLVYQGSESKFTTESFPVTGCCW